MTFYKADAAFESIAEMQSLELNDTDEDCLGVFIVPTDDNEFILVVWRKNSDLPVDDKTVWAGTQGRWIKVDTYNPNTDGGGNSGTIEGIHKDWEPNITYQGIIVGTNNSVAKSYKLGDLVYIDIQINTIYVYNNNSLNAMVISNPPYTPLVGLNMLNWSIDSTGRNIEVAGVYLASPDSADGGHLLALTTEQLLSKTTEQLLAMML